MIHRAVAANRMRVLRQPALRGLTALAVQHLQKRGVGQHFGFAALQYRQLDGINQMKVRRDGAARGCAVGAPVAKVDGFFTRLRRGPVFSGF